LIDSREIDQHQQQELGRSTATARRSIDSREIDQQQQQEVDRSTTTTRVKSIDINSSNSNSSSKR
jgi:hypothetical protein